MPVPLPALAVGEDLLEGGEHLGGGVHGEARLAEVGQRVRVPLEPPALRTPDAVAPEAERAGGGDRRVLLPEAAGGRVAGVGEGPLAPIAELLVQVLEGLQGKVHLAARLQPCRVPVTAQPDRDRAHGPDVGRDVVPRDAVSAGRAPRVGAVLVGEGHRHPVDLQLADELAPPPDHALDAVAPRVQLLAREGVVEREHLGPVADRREELRGLPAHPLGGAIGRDELGKLLLEAPEIPHELVELGVGDLGGVLHVVEVLVVADLVAKLLDP